jgi:hypothetical protein
MSRRIASLCAAALLVCAAQSRGQATARAQLGTPTPAASGSAESIWQGPPASAGFIASPYLPATSATDDSGKESQTGKAKEEPSEQDKLAALDKAVTEIAKKLTVVTADENFKLVLGGAIIADFLYDSARPVAPGTPFFLTSGPLPGFRQQTFDAGARQTTVSALVLGPDICGFKSSAVIVANFYSSSLVEDLWGFLPLQAYAQLKNDDWRFAAGLQLDIFNPLNPTVLPLSYLGASGNTGAFRGQARVERYLYPGDDQQITLTGGLSDPIPTTVSNTFRLSEDNGWPNIEGRAAWAVGPLCGEGDLARRPFEVGVSGVVGQIRTTVPFTRQVVDDVWGVGTDLRWAVTERFGFQGELYGGQTLGTYMGGILQNINTKTFTGVHTGGGWIEVYYYICPEKLHTHIGYGIDDPLDRNLAPGQPVRNDTYFVNVIWNVTKHFQLAEEFTYRKTEYTVVPNNHGYGLQSQVQFKF